MLLEKKLLEQMLQNKIVVMKNVRKMLLEKKLLEQCS